MKEIYYLTSRGERINLIQEPYMMLEETDLFNYSWESITSGENFPKIKGMKKGFISPQFTIDVSGTSEIDFANNLEHLISAFDGDVYRNKMGRLYVGNNYRNCFIQGASFPKVFKTKMASVGFTAISDVADWVEWETINLSGAGNTYERQINDSINYLPSNNSSTLDVEVNNDFSVMLKWTNENPAGYMLIDFGEVKEITAINDLVFSKSTIGLATLDVEVSSDGNTYEKLETITFSIGGGKQYKEFDYNEPLEIRYLRLRNTGPMPIWSIESTNFAIYTQVKTTENILKEETIEPQNAKIFWGDDIVSVEKTSSLDAKLFIDARYVKHITLETVQNDAIISVEGLVGELWRALGSGMKTVDVEVDADCEKVRVSLTNGDYFYFYHPNENFVITGVLNKKITNDSYAPSDAIIRIGESLNPYVTIGLNTYGADVTVEEGFFLEIDTKEQTVRLYEQDGMTFENVYDKRTDGCFEKIESGINDVEWFGMLDVEIQLEKGRSTPKWN